MASLCPYSYSCFVYTSCGFYGILALINRYMDGQIWVEYEDAHLKVNMIWSCMVNDRDTVA